MKNKSARKYRSALTNELLSEISPVERLQANTKMVLAARLDDLLIEKGLGKSEFAEILNKNPSEVSKWLSGTQNFTIDTLAEIAVALDISMSDFFIAQNVRTVNKIHINIIVKEVKQVIPYITPSSINTPVTQYHSGSKQDALLPLTYSISA